MKVGIPNMGGLALIAKPLFEELGLGVVEIPEPNRTSIELGIKHAPECACFPLKVVLGDFIAAYKRGADYLAILGGCGPCRFGCYGAVLEVILRRLGYKIEVLIADSFKGPCTQRMMEVLGLKRLTSSKILSVAKTVYRNVRLMERIGRLARKTRPFERRKGDTDKVVSQALALMKQGGSIGKIKQRIEESFKLVEKDMSRKPVRVGLVGEIFMVIEAEANLHIERKLGQLGALVDRRGVGILGFILGSLGIAHRIAKRAAKPYLMYSVGGESINSVGYSVLYAKWGYDGIVHISPFGCMPEIVAQTIMDKVSRDHNIPILNIVLDEHVVETGLQTRLEAFVDLLERRKQSKNKWV